MALSFFSRLFKKPIINVLKKGALIVDVRTPFEYDQGRIPESINIPVERITVNEQRLLEMKRPIIFCCSDGSRSRQVYQKLAGKGMKNIYYGGNWTKLLKIISNL
jgi:phage shock protein E